MAIYTVRIFLIFLFLNGCTPQKTQKIQNVKEGEQYLFKVRMLNKILNTTTRPVYSRDTKHLSYDSMLIVEGVTVNIFSDELKNENVNFSIDKYVFVDYRTRSFYEYLNFSDTAKIIDKFPQPDSAFPKGGWKFFNKEQMLPLENLTDLPDTTIDNIQFKRVKSYKMILTTEGIYAKQIQIAYLRCDKKGFLHSLDNPLSNKLGCPVVKIEYHFSDNISGISAELEILRSELTPAEIKVFEAWRKNARENPVR